MDAILSEFPQADIIIYPESAYVDLKNAPGGYHLYGNWGAFVNGLLSTKPDQGVTLLTECDYQWKDPLQIIQLHGEVNAATQLAMEDQLYWMHKCGIGHGAGLYDGKNGHMSWQTPQQFAEQWKTMGQLSAKYRFIFAGESSFAYYPQGAGKCGITSFGNRLAKDADLYFKVIRDDLKSRLTE